MNTNLNTLSIFIIFHPTTYTIVSLYWTATWQSTLNCKIRTRTKYGL